ncbi:hypothetical protein FMUBM48_14510 [Nocardia cyriacigeorgica]|nr:hypothetical protein FMUBM48_14510 [Nocardia cyriacigeorgica]
MTPGERWGECRKATALGARPAKVSGVVLVAVGGPEAPDRQPGTVRRSVNLGNSDGAEPCAFSHRPLPVWNSEWSASASMRTPCQNATWFMIRRANGLGFG